MNAAGFLIVVVVVLWLVKTGKLNKIYRGITT